MPFKKGEVPPGAKVFEKGKSGNPKGKPAGVHNRATIAKKVLSLRALMPESLLTQLRKIYPQVEKSMTIEEIMTMVQAKQAIHGDNQSYKMLMDSAFGAPKQEIDGNIDGNIILRFDKQDEQIGSDDDFE